MSKKIQSGEKCEAIANLIKKRSRCMCEYLIKKCVEI